MQINDTPALRARFWAKVDRSGECWSWTASLFRTGYGQFQCGGRPHPAHRIAYELTFGPIPDDLFVCHRCDNPPCCRPDHLFLGTPADNVHDAQDKARRPRRMGPKRPGLPMAHPGEANGRAKLTAPDVLEIRRRYAAGGTSFPKLAGEFGVSFGVIFRVVKRKSWQHV